MNLIIRNNSSQPIYEQIYEQIKTQILNGEMHEGDVLPSMRQLAKDLRISVITTKRAYDELEQDGFLVSVPGKGSYVAEKNLELVRESHLKEAEDHLQAALTAARLAGITAEELVEVLIWLSKEKE